jgi:F0F1-type ATP synthase membrane subunit a
VFYLVLALGVGIVQQARVTFHSNLTFDMRVAGNILALAVVFALISLRVPASAAARVAGGAHLGIGHALRGL